MTNEKRKAEDFAFSFERQRQIRLAIRGLVARGRLSREDAYVAIEVLEHHVIHSDGRCSPGFPDIAVALGCSVPTIERAFRQLRSCGVLRRERRGYSKWFDIVWANVVNGAFVPFADDASKPSRLMGSKPSDVMGSKPSRLMGSSTEEDYGGYRTEDAERDALAPAGRNLRAMRSDFCGLGAHEVTPHEQDHDLSIRKERRIA